jgi:hypothetical protein
MSMKLGKDAVGYYHATAGTELGDMSAVFSGASDIQLSMGAGAAKTSTRGGGGWDTELPTLRALSVSMKIPLDPTDAGYIALMTAFTTGALIAAAFLTDTKATAGAEGPVGSFAVTKFDRGEPLDGVLEVDVELKLSAYLCWCKVGVGNVIEFTTQPSASSAEDAAFAQQPVVTIKDAAGNTITTGTDATATVTISLQTGLGTLAGTLTKQAVAGVADFAGLGLAIDTAGTDKVLKASAPTQVGTVTALTSPAFTITAA